MKRGHVFLAIGWLALAFSAAAQTASPRSAEYLIGPGDVLVISFPDHPDLDREVTVRTDGTVTLPSVGVIQIAQLARDAAEALILRKYQLYDPGIGEISLNIAQYNSLRVYVLGAVVAPGSYSFPSAPSVWEAIRAAGGPEPGAALASVRVVPADDPAQARVYDLRAIQSGVGTVPEDVLRGGDTVIVPGADAASVIDPDLGVQVFGHVNTPGIVPLAEPRRLLTVLMMAGAPATTGELKKVDWVHREANGGIRASRINVNLFLQEGLLAGNPLVYPGDSVHVHGQRSGWLRNNLPVVLGVVSATAAFLLAYDRLAE